MFRRIADRAAGGTLKRATAKSIGAFRVRGRRARTPACRRRESVPVLHDEMTAHATKEIEAQFASLSRGEQLDLLERLRQQVHSGVAGDGVVTARLAVARAADPEVQHPVETVSSGQPAKEYDLLSEAW